ncbi:hypothetical protein [Actinomadura bangladeshensis]|uniref:Uncharacterized protein n=1 Tax=Actinomadura bangladeshensis TaxID=453573 RepID=A0A6L9QAJ7_9ACTN|nr:hypothetical protein [Actinomadura bangladeshensis]NEA21567.1 hypothetical protein [Actinomadura bangladeshensis]NEA22527.1 hypothetical protein [Actinomadura bangladeshensis]
MSSKGTCTGCGQTRHVTTGGLMYRHNGADHRPCPGSGRLPEEAGVAPAMVADVLDQLIQDVPVRHLDGHGAVVLLADLTAAIDTARTDAGLPPLRAGNG